MNISYVCDIGITANMKKEKGSDAIFVVKENKLYGCKEGTKSKLKTRLQYALKPSYNKR